MRIDGGYLERVLTGLVRINSINPTLVPGGGGEAEVARFVGAELGRLGLVVDVVEHAPGRPSVLGSLRGTGGGRSLMLNAHYDTVGIGGMSEPFSARVEGGRLYGRGAYDMKGSLAASMACAEALVRSGTALAGDLVIAAVADEEYGSIGTAGIIPRCPVDAAIVTEPTALNICLAHKGYLWVEVEIDGRAAHGSRFELGIDANMRMGRFLSRLETLERDLRRRPPHPLVGPPSLHAALLSGGTGLSTYAASSRLEIERRTVPGETVAQAVGEIQAIAGALGAEDESFVARVRPFFSREPFEVARDAAIVRVLDAAVRETVHREPVYMGDTPWMDSALLQGAGVETVVIGPAGAGAHADIEWVDLDSCVALAEILARSAISYCGAAS